MGTFGGSGSAGAAGAEPARRRVQRVQPARVQRVQRVPARVRDRKPRQAPARRRSPARQRARAWNRCRCRSRYGCRSRCGRNRHFLVAGHERERHRFGRPDRPGNRIVGGVAAGGAPADRAGDRRFPAGPTAALRRIRQRSDKRSAGFFASAFWITQSSCQAMRLSCDEGSAGRSCATRWSQLLRIAGEAEACR